jgi:hypothetical protein
MWSAAEKLSFLCFRPRLQVEPRISTALLGSRRPRSRRISAKTNSSWRTPRYQRPSGCRHAAGGPLLVARFHTRFRGMPRRNQNAVSWLPTRAVRYWAILTTTLAADVLDDIAGYALCANREHHIGQSTLARNGIHQWSAAKDRLRQRLRQIGNRPKRTIRPFLPRPCQLSDLHNGPVYTPDRSPAHRHRCVR